MSSRPRDLLTIPNVSAHPIPLASAIHWGLVCLTLTLSFLISAASNEPKIPQPAPTSTGESAGTPTDSRVPESASLTLRQRLQRDAVARKSSSTY